MTMSCHSQILSIDDLIMLSSLTVTAKEITASYRDDVMPQNERHTYLYKKHQSIHNPESVDQKRLESSNIRLVVAEKELVSVSIETESH